MLGLAAMAIVQTLRQAPLEITCAYSQNNQRAQAACLEPKAAGA